MKPTNVDARLWEACQAKILPSWVAHLSAVRTAPHRPTAARIASLVHEAINVRAGNVYGNPNARPSLDQRNAISLLVLVRKNQTRQRAAGYWISEPDGSAPPKTLREYMVANISADRRGTYYRRWLRRMQRDV